MPEFTLDTTSAPDFEALPEITKGYITTLFFMHQNTPGVAMGIDGDGHVHTRWLTMAEVLDLDDPQPIKAHWMHPEIQHRLEEGMLDGEIPADCGAADIDPETLKTIAAHVSDWYEAHREIADRAAAIYGMESVGSDLAFTESGSGVGFWSREELEEDGLGDKLSDACERTESCAYYHPETGKVSFY